MEYLRLHRLVRGDFETNQIVDDDDIRLHFHLHTDTMMSQLQRHARWDEMSQFYEAQDAVVSAAARRDFAEAARHLPAVLPSLIDIAKKMRAQGSAAMTFDVLRGGSVAAAALHPNDDVDQMFASIAADPATPDPDVHKKMLTLRGTMAAVAKALQDEDGLATKNRIRDCAGITDGRLLNQALTWLVKAGLLFEAAGGYSTTGRPAPTSRPVDITPMQPAPATAPVPAALVHLLDHPRVAGPDTYAAERPQAALPVSPTSVQVADLMATPTDLRPAGTAKIAVTAGTTWLLTYKHPAGAPARQWTATIYGQAGNPLRTVTLPAPVQSWSAGPDRDWVSILGDDLHLTVYRETGDRLTDIRLDQLPEVTDRLRNGGAGWQVRVADHDITTGRTLVTFEDSVWMLDHGGQTTWGARVPEKVYPSGAWKPDEVPPEVRRRAVQLGLPEDLTAREAISYLSANDLIPAPFGTGRGVGDRAGSTVARLEPGAELAEHLGEITPDRIEVGRLTHTGATISTRYALNADFDNDGQVTRLWNTAGTLNTLAEHGRRRIGATGRAIVEVTDHIVLTEATVPARVGDRSGSPSPVHDLATAAGDTIAGPGWVARLDGPTLTVVTDHDRTPRTYQLPKKPSALVVQENHLRAHIGAKHALIPLRPN